MNDPSTQIQLNNRLIERITMTQLSSNDNYRELPLDQMMNKMLEEGWEWDHSIRRCVRSIDVINPELTVVQVKIPVIRTDPLVILDSKSFRQIIWSVKGAQDKDPSYVGPFVESGSDIDTYPGTIILIVDQVTKDSGQVFIAKSALVTVKGTLETVSIATGKNWSNKLYDSVKKSLELGSRITDLSVKKSNCEEELETIDEELKRLYDMIDMTF